MNILNNRYTSLLSLLAISAQLTGCFVAVPNDRSDDGSYYEEDYVYSDERSEEFYSEETFEEEIIEETIEEEITVEEEISSEGDSIVASTPVPTPSIEIIFEETFESPNLDGIDRLAMNTIGQWAIDWTPGSRCERFSGTASIELQSDVDVGSQFEVEGNQHARLDGRCGQDLNPSRITTSIADVQGARTLSFYARVAETAPHAELMVEWNDEIVMNEPLLDVWAEYVIDLEQLGASSSALLSMTALNPGVLIDHIRVE
jgi:hypothetical protein